MSDSTQQSTSFLFRWVVNSLGIWIAANIFDTVTLDGGWWAIVGTGLILSLVNSLLKPLLTVLAFPAIVITLGIFMIFVNGLVVFIADWLAPGLSIDGFGSAVLASLVIGLLNYILSTSNQKG